MSSIATISKQTIENLNKKNKDITPAEYTKEFCKLAKEVNLTVNECVYFQETLSKIQQNEFNTTSKKNPETIYDLVDILIKRVPKKNIENMSEMLQASMQPSISLSIGDDLKSFCIKIGDSPSLIFEESIQKEMKKYIQNRFHVDQKILSQKTADIARLISLMNKYLSDAIDSNNLGSNNVTNIKNELESICPKDSTQEDLHKLQTKLVKAAVTMENEISTVNKNLESGQNDVLLLEQKVKRLEDELQKSQETSLHDHLTGINNRRSLEEELQKIENKFIRNKQDYAIIFFDIDHFKKINDLYTHDAGDVILKTFASLLTKLTREIDIVARYGGEEFIAVVDFNKANDLYKYVERIKGVVTKNKFIYKQHKIEIKFSAGVQIRSNSISPEETIFEADKLLYKAKRTGRNKVVFWDGKEI